MNGLSITAPADELARVDKDKDKEDSGGDKKQQNSGTRTPPKTSLSPGSEKKDKDDEGGADKRTTSLTHPGGKARGDKGDKGVERGGDRGLREELVKPDPGFDRRYDRDHRPAPSSSSPQPQVIDLSVLEQQHQKELEAYRAVDYAARRGEDPYSPPEPNSIFVLDFAPNAPKKS